MSFAILVQMSPCGWLQSESLGDIQTLLIQGPEFDRADLTRDLRDARRAPGDVVNWSPLARLLAAFESPGQLFDGFDLLHDRWHKLR